MFRIYCHVRVRRIRKKLKFTHGRTRFQKKQIEPKHCTDARYVITHSGTGAAQSFPLAVFVLALICFFLSGISFLELVLVSAERAWAQAMELKEQQEQNPRAKHHSLRRLEKSAKWTRHLVTVRTESLFYFLFLLRPSSSYSRFGFQLCDVVGAQRTKLEAQAYSSWMQGNVMRERKRWKEAVDHMVRARTIYQQLAKVGLQEQQDLYLHRCDDIETIVTFCQYNLGGKDAASADIRKVLAAASEDPELQRLKAELDVRHEGRLFQSPANVAFSF